MQKWHWRDFCYNLANIPIEVISRVTGLTQEKVKKLKE